MIASAIQLAAQVEPSPAAPLLPAVRRRAGGTPATAAPAGKAECFEQGGREELFAGMIFDNRNEFQQPRLPVLMIRRLRKAGLRALQGTLHALFGG